MRRPDRFETHRSMLLAGPRRVYAFAEGPSLIPAAWRAFGGEWPLPGQVGHASYGVTCGADMAAGVFEYMPAVEVETFETLDDRWGRVRVPEAHYAVFAHAGPIGGIRQKMFGAVDAGATWFLAPADNCDEVVGHIPSGLRVFKVSTLDDALDALKAIRGDGGVDALPTCS